MILCPRCFGTGHGVWIENRYYVECPECHAVSAVSPRDEDRPSIPPTKETPTNG